MGEKRDVSVSLNCGGCIATVLAVVAIWALIFGVTVGGKHYGILRCNADHGVEVDR